MTESPAVTEQRWLAEAIRAACIQAALQGYEQAATDGLCDAGAWECAVETMRSLDIDRVLREFTGQAAG